MAESGYKPFPLLEINNRDIDKYRCLWVSEDKHERCIASFCTFEHFLQHLTEDHNLPLRSNIDFFESCEHIFDLYMEGVEHYVNHAISCEENSWKKLGDLESREIRAHHFFEKLKEIPTRDIWVHNLFEKLKEIRKELLEHLLFGESPLKAEPI